MVESVSAVSTLNAYSLDAAPDGLSKDVPGAAAIYRAQKDAFRGAANARICCRMIWSADERFRLVRSAFGANVAAAAFLRPLLPSDPP